MACLDVTNLEKMYETNKTSANSTVIMRLTMYGTVDAYYSNGNTTIDLALIGSPIMRFTHPDDVVHLCAGLSQATKTTVANFTLRCRFGTAEAPWEPFHFTAIARSNNIMCLIQPTISLPDQAHSTLHVKAHRRFWKTKSKTISTIAKNLMHLLMILLQLWTTSPKHVVWFDVRSVVQLAIAEAKARPEIRRLLDLLAWAGLIRQPNTTQSRFEAVADHKSTWLVTWPASSTICCDAL
ncbi:hypothetical protein DFQ28_008427 [Apophysomyces sp. BC1034]|nr:hypothetical protein DFQ28_008427 [Apophysomyces sp. BC1034]